MRLRRFDRMNDFYRRAEGLLARREAEHNLLLGICAGLIEHPERVAAPPYLATVEDGGAVVAAAVRTPPHNLVLSLAPPAALDCLADDLRRHDSALPGVLGPAIEARVFADRWAALTGYSVRPGVAQRIYELDAVAPVMGVPGSLRPAEAADRDLLASWMNAFFADAHGWSDLDRAEQTVDDRLSRRDAGLVLWVDGAPVSLAGYGGPTPTGIRIGPVYTPPAHRRRGYASAAVAALSQRLLDGGRRRCFLFTDLANPTANHIYQAIGYRPVCDVDEYRFLLPITAWSRSGGE